MCTRTCTHTRSHRQMHHTHRCSCMHAHARTHAPSRQTDASHTHTHTHTAETASLGLSVTVSVWWASSEPELYLPLWDATVGSDSTVMSPKPHPVSLESHMTLLRCQGVRPVRRRTFSGWCFPSGGKTSISLHISRKQRSLLVIHTCQVPHLPKREIHTQTVSLPGKPWNMTVLLWPSDISVRLTPLMRKHMHKTHVNTPGVYESQVGQLWKTSSRPRLWNEPASCLCLEFLSIDWWAFFCFLNLTLISKAILRQEIRFWHKGLWDYAPSCDRKLVQGCQGEEKEGMGVWRTGLVGGWGGWGDRQTPPGLVITSSDKTSELTELWISGGEVSLSFLWHKMEELMNWGDWIWGLRATNGSVWICMYKGMCSVFHSQK